MIWINLDQIQSQLICALLWLASEIIFNREHKLHRSKSPMVYIGSHHQHNPFAIEVMDMISLSKEECGCVKTWTKDG